MRHTRKIAVGAAALAVVGGGVFYGLRYSRPVEKPFYVAGDGPPAYAPGAVDPAVTQANIGTTICHAGYTRAVRPPVSYTDPIKHELELSYGNGDTNGSHWETDHRVPLAAGGAPRSRLNLWLEPIAAAKVKDKLEVRVQHDICSGRLTLTQGQAVFLGDWHKTQVP